MFLLLVTWLVAGQPPSSYQQQFKTEKACALAKLQLDIEGAKLKAEEDNKNAVAEQNGFHVVVAGDPPRVSAICVAQ